MGCFDIMLAESIYNTNISFSTGNDVRTITNDFLRSRHLSHFSYIRIYDNNTTIVLTTHPEISEEFYRNEFYKLTKYDKSARSLQSAALLWLAMGPDDQVLMNYIKENYNISNGIVLTKQYDNYCEYCFFGAENNNAFVNNYYLANLDELYNFCYYFKEKAKDMILAAQADPILLCDYDSTIETVTDYQYAERQSAITITDPLFKRLYYTRDLDKSITKREFQCLSGLASGQRVKSIANELKLTERSIRYYIENLKNKIGLSQQAQLVQFYHELF